MSDKYLLKWKLFRENIEEYLQELRDDKKFSNVTLAFDDENFIEANSFVLSASSIILKSIIKKSRQPHTFIFLSGIASTMFSHLMDYMYNGEVNLPQEDVDTFLAAANTLKIKGLVQNTEKADNEKADNIDNEKEEEFSPETFNTNLSGSFVSESILDTSNRCLPPQTNFENVVEPLNKEIDSDVTRNSKIEPFFNIADVEDQMDIFVERCECQVCGKNFPYYRKLSNHMDECHGQDGVFHPCHYCDKTFRTKNARNVHKFRNHK